jgi:hypothetical protein
VGFKNLHVVNALPGTMYWTRFQFFSDAETSRTIKIFPPNIKGWSIGLMFQKNVQMSLHVKGVTARDPTEDMIFGLKKKLGSDIEKYDTSRIYLLDDNVKEGTLEGLKLPKSGIQSMLLLVPPVIAVSDSTMSIVLLNGDNQNDGIGGSTFVLRTVKL